MMMIRLFALFLPVLTAASAYGQNREISKGNKEYNEKRYRNAEAAYREAISKKPGEFTGIYNLGNALYRQEKFEDAAQQYMSAMGNEKNPASRSKAFYNLGNALLKNQQYKESVDAYKQALKINPDDEDARYNLSYALQKLKQQQQQSGQNKDQKNKDQQQKDQQKDQQKKEQEQKDEQQQAGQDKKEQEKKQQKKEPKMSKEEAERMLRALKNDEKDLQKEKARKFKVVNANPEKDW